MLRPAKHRAESVQDQADHDREHRQPTLHRRATGVRASPNTPNTATNPSVIAAVAVSARPTDARVEMRAPASAPITKRERYAGSIANPQGLTAAKVPAASANARLSVDTGTRVKTCC